MLNMFLDQFLFLHTERESYCCCIAFHVYQLKNTSPFFGVIAFLHPAQTTLNFFV